MRALFILCTTLTVLEVFDVSITGVSAVQTPARSAPPVGNGLKKAPQKPVTPLPKANAIPTSAVKPPPPAARPRPPAVSPALSVKPTVAGRNSPPAPIPAAKLDEGPVRTSPRMAARGLPVKPPPKKPAAQPVNNEKNEEGHNDDSESEPKTIMDSSKHLVNTMKDEANKRGAGVVNTVTEVVKLGSNTLGLFGKLIRSQTRNVHTIATDSFGLLSGLGNSSTKGAQNILKSTGEIGKESANMLNKTLRSATDLGKNAIKLGGNVLTTPLSIGSDVANLSNHVVAVPSKISKYVTNSITNTLLPIMGDDEKENPTN